MKTITVENIINATGGQLVCGSMNAEVSGIRHDSRECQAGDMFVAIVGRNQDGHKYIPKVYESGCRTYFVSHTDGWMEEMSEDAKAEINVILVEDTILQMGELASWYLDQLDIRRVAVTGSVGKTSVRDLIYYVLSEKYNCGKNLKNYNNNIGLPISIFQFEEDTNAAVLEMGMDNFGEIEYLSNIVKPEIGVITNIGVAHMEKLGSRDGIFKAKMEITENLRPKAEGGALVYARDDEYLNKERISGDYIQVSAGGNGKCDYIISDVDDLGLDGIRFNLEHQEITHVIELPVPGLHNAVNAAIAIAVGNLLGVDIESAKAGLSKVELTGSRLKKVLGKSVTIIDDTYNANPDSMKSALKVLDKSSCEGRKIAFLGDMFELGEDEEKLHYGVGMFARGLRIDCVITTGELGGHIARGAEGGELEVKHYADKKDMLADIRKIVKPGDMILVKGSRGMHMEDVVEKAVQI